MRLLQIVSIIHYHCIRSDFNTYNVGLFLGTLHTQSIHIAFDQTVFYAGLMNA